MNTKKIRVNINKTWEFEVPVTAPLTDDGYVDEFYDYLQRQNTTPEIELYQNLELLCEVCGDILRGEECVLNMCAKCATSITCPRCKSLMKYVDEEMLLQRFKCESCKLIVTYTENE